MNETPVCFSNKSSDCQKISAAQAVSGLKELGQLQVDPGNGIVYWVEFCPQMRISRLMTLRAEKPISLTPENFSVRSRVHEYGGLSWCITEPGSWVFVNESDQQIYRQSDTDPTPRSITNRRYSRFGNPTYDRFRQRIVCIEESHQGGGVTNRLVAICLDSGRVSNLHTGHDFYSDIAINPQGDRLAFICWDHPSQPWLKTHLIELSFSVSGEVVLQRQLSREGANQQPLYTGRGELRVLSDQDGWWNIYAWSEQKQSLQGFICLDSDCGVSPWQFGGQHHFISGEDHWFIRIDQAAMQLCRYREHEPIYRLNCAASFFRSIGVFESRLFCLQASESESTYLAEYDLMALQPESTPRYRWPLPDELTPRNSPVPAEHLTIPVGSEQAYGLFYRPRQQECPPPVVFFFHGGPTSCSYPVFNPMIQFWVERGFAVLNLNYRGSSGYGRNYRMRLHKNWGDLDVADAIAARTFLVKEGLVNPNQVFVRGSSAGGFTALLCLIREPGFAGAGCLYGVTDPISLRGKTHKFESCYLDWLIGNPEVSEEPFQQRSAVMRADEIRSPVIFFQGEKDPVVVPQQTRDLIKRLETRIHVESSYYPNEAHGFRSAEVLADVLEREYQFYSKIINDRRQ